jgi:eukaryotic-like serine/threonine-protein kinase
MSELTGFDQLRDALRDRYTIEREIGRGGMATVYLADDRKLHRRVAVKVLHQDLATIGSERFLREIRIAAGLSHPNILALHDAGEVDGRLLYAMPYVEGESLRHRLNREQQLPVPEAIRIAGQVAAALAHAHEHGIVHRDIKPENILLAGDQALVADFGIAKALDAASAERLTASGLSMGTPVYMSPEQGSGDAVDGRSDIYALGCVLYEMLAGAPPFLGPSAQAILARHAVDPVPPLRTVRARVPEAVEQAIERALAKVPAYRFATADEFAQALASPAAPRPHWRGAGFALVGLSAAALGAAGVAALRHVAHAPVLPAAATSIAVLPLGVAGPDSAMRRLSQDLAVTVSASLDGVGGITTTDRLVLAGERLERRTISLAEAGVLARRLGASSFLQGSLVATGDKVRVDGRVYSTDSVAPIAPPFTVIAHRDSLVSLTDSISWAVLHAIWRRHVPPTPSIEAVTTHSIPALRGFLDGERLIAADRWREAGLAFAAAVALDSGFVLAQFRYLLSRVWSDQEWEPRAIAALRAGRSSLPERERLLVAAVLDTMSESQRLEAFRLVAEHYPGYWPGWLSYGDMQFHYGPRLGHDWREGLAAFQRAVALEPDLAPAWEHMDGLTYGRDEVENSSLRRGPGRRP